MEMATCSDGKGVLGPRRVREIAWGRRRRDGGGDPSKGRRMGGRKKRGGFFCLCGVLVLVLLCWKSFRLGALRVLQDSSQDVQINAPSATSVEVSTNHALASITPELASLLHPLHKVTFQGHTFFMAGHADEYMSKEYMSKGRFYETSVTEGIIRYQKQYGGDILDIGLNIGSISIPAAYFCQGCKVIGIEAIPTNYQKAVANGKLNGLINLIPIHVALQDNQDLTSLTFQINRANMGSSTAKMSQEVNENEKVSAPATTLDKLRPQLKNVRVVKIDIEGSEAIAIQGGLTWLEENPPCVIIMEVDKIDMNEMTSVLKAKGFAMYSGKQEGIYTNTPNAVFKSNGMKCKQKPDYS